MTFLRSNEVLAAALLASTLTNTDAYGSSYYRPSLALGSRLVPSYYLGGSPSIFSRDIRRVDVMDDIFDSIIADIDNAFYNPRLLSLQHNMMRSRPSTFFLQRGAHNALDSVQITHDDTQHKLVMDLQGASANDIVLHLEEDERMLRISGETKQEDGGISVHSRFDRSFNLDRDVDMSKISAQIDDGVLTIVAPKYELEEVKRNIRRIDIVENKNIDSVVGNGASSDEQADTPASSQNKEEESPAMLEQEVVDENVNVIDLDFDLKTE